MIFSKFSIREKKFEKSNFYFEKKKKYFILFLLENKIHFFERKELLK